MRIDLSGLLSIGTLIVNIVKNFANSEEVKDITKEASESLTDAAVAQLFKAIELKADEMGKGEDYDSAMVIIESIIGKDLDKDNQLG